MLRIVPEDFEIVSVEPVQTICRTEPHESLAVLRNAPDRTLGKTLIHVEDFVFEPGGSGEGG